MNRQDILEVLQQAQEMKTNCLDALLKNKVMAGCFFEPSTRTRLSFESAMKRLGGEVIGFTNPEETSTKKGESLEDTIKVISLYSDIIILRHPAEGAAARAAAVSSVPVINAGDGAHEHPTQTLTDLFSIHACQNRLDQLNIAFMGDLLYSRTVHSLALAMNHFKNRLYFISPPSLSLPDWVSRQLNSPFSRHGTLEEVIDQIDILYVTRMQKERHLTSDPSTWSVSVEALEKGRSHLKVLHPLPRQQEITPALDATPYAYYFNQAKNGLYVRQALLARCLGAR